MKRDPFRLLVDPAERRKLVYASRPWRRQAAIAISVFPAPRILEVARIERGAVRKIGMRYEIAFETAKGGADRTLTMSASL